jgi:hypothetical protein
MPRMQYRPQGGHDREHNQQERISVNGNSMMSFVTSSNTITIPLVSVLEFMMGSKRL